VIPKIGGKTPLYKPNIPSALIAFETTSMMPVYVPGAAVWSRTLVKKTGELFGRRCEVRTGRYDASIV
jgi:hypothetical protein